MNTRIFVTLCLGSALVFASCTKKTDTTTVDSTRTADTAHGNGPGDTTLHAQPAVPLTDASILAELEAQDSSAINQARYVKYHTKNKDVLAFANMMWTDHLKFIRSGQTITNKDKIDPASPGLAKDKEAMANTMANLMSADSTLDLVYISHAVDYIGKQVTHLHDWQTAAQNSYLKAKIATEIPIVQSHLNNAKSLLLKLNGGK